MKFLQIANLQGLKGAFAGGIIPAAPLALV